MRAILSVLQYTNTFACNTAHNFAINILGIHKKKNTNSVTFSP